MKKILVIIPAYNEAKAIVKTVNSLMRLKDIDYIVINDGSTDDTLSILKFNNIPHINLSFNLGIGGAVQTGYKYAFENNYDIAVQFDGDGQHNPTYIASLVERIYKGDNMVIGSRFISSKNKFMSTRLRQMGIKLISLNLKLFTKRTISDPTSGFRAVDKKVMEVFAKKYPYDYPEPVTTAELLTKSYRISEVPVEMHKREHGKSSISALKSVIYMVKVNFMIVNICLRGKL